MGSGGAALVVKSHSTHPSMGIPPWVYHDKRDSDETSTPRGSWHADYTDHDSPEAQPDTG
jgi:hypothetical protein